MKLSCKAPLDVPPQLRSQYLENINMATHSTGKLMLFAGDQKVEHLNNDFYGDGISSEDSYPEHLFKIASQAKIGVFAAQLGLVARYGCDYPEVPYLLKINSKTNLVKKDQADPFSGQWYDMDQVAQFKEDSGLKVLGVGITVYFGSEYEAEMIQQAAQTIYQAHQHGLIAVIWAYPRGKAVEGEKDPHLIAGAAGAAACLGADFVKVNFPKPNEGDAVESLKEAVLAAGKTGLVCAGGSATDPKKFLETLHRQINVAGAVGNATGRNIHQKSLKEAVRFCNAIYAITVENQSVEKAWKIFQGK